MSTLKIEHIANIANSGPDVSIDTNGHLNVVNGSLQMGGTTMLDSSDTTIKNVSKIGIGTSNPTATLQITPPNEHQDSFRIYRGGSSGYQLNYLNMSLYQGNTVFNTTSTDSSGKRYLFQINGTEKVRIDQEGEVGIGTNNPQTTLHLDTQTSGLPRIRLDHQNSNAEVFELGGGVDGITNSGFSLRNVTDSANVYYIDSNNHHFFNTASITQSGANPILKIETSWLSGNYGQLRLGYVAGEERSITGHYDDGIKIKVNANTHVFDTNGRLGIGTTSPNWKFTVEGSANDDWISRIYNTNTNGSGTLIRTDATSANDKIALGVYADSGYKMVVRSTGRVGIGTTTPNSPLHVHGDGITLRLDGTGNTTRTILFRSTSTTNPGEIYADGSLRLRTEDASTAIIFNTNSSGTNNEAMRIDSNQNVIGQKYFESQNSQGSVAFYATTAGSYNQQNGSGGTAWAYGSTGGTNSPATSASTTFGFHHWNGSAWSNPLNISTSGNLGIGITSPTVPVHVSPDGTYSKTTPFSLTGGKIYSNDIYTDYVYKWSGYGTRTVDLLCNSYHMMEVTYTSHQTNGGSDIHRFIKGKWANNHTTHTWTTYHDSGNTWSIGLSISATDQSGSSSGSPNGRLRVRQTYGSGSYSYSTLTIRTYYDAFQGIDISTS